MPVKIPVLQGVVTFLGRRSKRERLVLYWTIFFVFLTLVDRLVFSPLTARIRFLNKEIEAKETAITQALHMLGQKERILSESAKYAVFLAAAKSEEEQFTIILKEIESLANKASVYIIDMKPGGVRAEESFKQFMANVNCEGEMAQLVRFMYDIESSSKMITIEKYQLSPKSPESKQTLCSMTIVKTALP